MALTKQNTIDNFRVLINECDSLIQQSIQNKSIQWEGFQRWRSACQESLALVFTNQSQTFQNYQRIIYLPPVVNASQGIDTELIYFIQGIKTAKEILEGAVFIVIAWWQDNTVSEPIKAIPFISYGGKKGKKVAYKIKSFLTALNVQSLIVEDFPNLGLSLDNKVQLLMSLSNVGIVVLTGEDVTKKGEIRARQNVIHELSALNQLENVSPRIIYFKDNSVVLPSNIRNIAWHPLNVSNLENVYIEIAKELKTFGFYL